MACSGATSARCRNLSVQWSRWGQADPDPPKPAIYIPDHDDREDASLGGFGSEIGFICIPFGDLDGYSSADCADSELGEGFLFPLSDGVLWCNYGEVSQPLGALE